MISSYLLFIIVALLHIELPRSFIANLSVAAPNPGVVSLIAVAKKPGGMNPLLTALLIQTLLALMGLFHLIITKDVPISCAAHKIAVAMGCSTTHLLSVACQSSQDLNLQPMNSSPNASLEKRSTTTLLLSI
jgi:hypothetical protein